MECHLQGLLDHGRMIWVAKNVLKTYGRDVCDLVLGSPNLSLVDTAYSKNRPDIADLAIKMYDRNQYDCVFVTSNPIATKQIVSACRAAGIHAFGPIFDS